MTKKFVFWPQILNLLERDILRVILFGVFLMAFSLLTASCNDDGGGDSPEQHGDASISLYGELNETQYSAGLIKILGEVKNTGLQSVNNVEVAFTFYDANGDFLGTNKTYVQGKCYKIEDRTIYTHTGLMPGDSGVFELLGTVYASQIGRYTYEFLYDLREFEIPEAEMVVELQVNHEADSYGHFFSSGTVRNIGVCDLVFGRVHMTLYDANDRIVEIIMAYINGESLYALQENHHTDTGLQAGHVATFEIPTSTDFSEVAGVQYRTYWADNKEFVID